MKHSFRPVEKDAPRRVYDDVATGAAARAAREAAGLSQTPIADIMGYTIMYISDLERGTRKWRESLITAYNAALVKAAARD